MKIVLGKKKGYPTADDLDKFLVGCARNMNDGYAMPFLNMFADARIGVGMTDCGEEDDYHIQMVLTLGDTGAKDIHELLKSIWTVIVVYGVGSNPVIVEGLPDEQGGENEGTHWLSKVNIQPTPWDYPRHYGLRFYSDGITHKPIRKSDKEKIEGAKFLRKGEKYFRKERKEHAKFIHRNMDSWEMTDKERSVIEKLLEKTT